MTESIARKVVLAAAFGALLSSAAAKAEIVYGLATGLTGGDNIFTFDSATPGVLQTAKFINGLQANESLVGIDIRPTNGMIYGIGSFDRLYTINPSTGAATFVAPLSTGLSGTSFDLDFNPVADSTGAASLRVVSDTGVNYAVNANTGAVTVQTAINATYGSPILSGAAYTTNFSGATSTSLYTIDAQFDYLNTQNPPASGTQTLVATLKDSGSNPVNVSTLLGFDISGATGTAYIGFQQSINGISQFSSINLGTGVITNIGATSQIGGGLFVRDITVAVPEPATLGLAGLAAAGLIARRRRA